MRERPSASRRKDFEEIEEGMTLGEAMQEASRCLRCDHFGMGSFKGGREQKW